MAVALVSWRHHLKACYQAIKWTYWCIQQNTSQKQYAKWKKLDSKDKPLYDSIFIKSWKRQNYLKSDEWIPRPRAVRRRWIAKGHKKIGGGGWKCSYTSWWCWLDNCTQIKTQNSMPKIANLLNVNYKLTKPNKQKRNAIRTTEAWFSDVLNTN